MENINSKNANIIESFTKNEDISILLDLARGIPEFFNEHGIALMKKDIEVDTIFVAKNNQDIVGFVSLKKITNDTSEISWMAVSPFSQGSGIGTRLLTETEGFLKEQGCKKIIVKTLAETDDYEPYKKTREFYKRYGFTSIGIYEDYPEWGDDPCQIFEKEIS